MKLKGKSAYLNVGNMKTVNQIKMLLAKHKEELKDRFKVAEIGVFGSYVRKEQTRKSDIDILVAFHETVDLFTFVELENYLSNLLGAKVDLVMKDGLKPCLKERILAEGCLRKRETTKFTSKT